MRAIGLLAISIGLLPACGDDGATGAGGAGTGGDAASTSTSTSASGAAGGGGGAEPEGLSLALYNVVRAEEDLAHSPLPAKLERVEIAPRVTILAKAMPGVASVGFTLDGGPARVDGMAPFLLDEEADGSAAPWSLAFGTHRIEARGYASTDGSGEPLHVVDTMFELSATGLDAAHVPLSQGDTDQWVDQNLDDVMEPRTFQGSLGSLPYRLFVPEHYDATVRYPLFIYLHGRGGRGTDNRAANYGTRLFSGPRSLVSPNFQADYPAIVVVPQCSDMPTHQEWAHWVGNSAQSPFAGLGSDGSYEQHADPWPSALAVRELTDALADEFTIEKQRVYLTGESMGGFGTWEFTTRWPEVFAVGVPMAGFSDRTKVSLITAIPFWVFHGDADSSNPVAGSRAMVAALEAAGGEVKYTEYAGAEHGPTFQKAWTEEPDLLAWMFAQRKK